MFGTVLTAAFAALLAYVAWRASSVPLLSKNLPRGAVAGPQSPPLFVGDSVQGRP